MAKVIAALLFAFGISLAGTAKAGATRCEGCSDAQFQAAAKALGPGRHVVSSFSTNRVSMYDVTQVAWDPPLWMAVPIAVSAEVKSVFDDAHHFYVETNATMKAAVVVKGTDLGVPGLTGTTTAYDVVTNANLRAQLGDRLASGTLPGWSNLDRAGEMIVQGLFAAVGAGDASIEITVQLEDGSTVVYKLTNNSGTGQYQAGRSRTKNNQLVPEANTPEYQGTWQGGTDQPSLGNHMGVIGATVIGTGNRGPMTCTWKGTTLTCTIRSN